MAFASPASAPAASSPRALPLGGSRPRARLDPRLVVGLALVLLSVAGVVGVVSAADHAVPVFAASSALSPGDRVRASDLVERRVVLDGADRLYLTASALPRSGVVVTRTIAKGELIPIAAVGSAGSADLTSVVVRVPGRVPAAVAAGATVEIWATGVPDVDGRAADPPAVIASATVARVLPADGVVDRDTIAVELLVPRNRIARLLQARSDGDDFALVPEALSLGGGS